MGTFLRGFKCRFLHVNFFLGAPQWCQLVSSFSAFSIGSYRYREILTTSQPHRPKAKHYYGVVVYV